MSDSENGVISEEELKEKLVLIRNEIMSEKIKRTELKEKYGISFYAMRDITAMTTEKFDYFLEQISYIKENIQLGEIPIRISSKLACGTSIVSFVAKEICQEYSDKNQNNKETQYKKIFKKIERIWKENQLGESIENLAKKYDIDTEKLRKFVSDFDSSLQKKREYYSKCKEVEFKVVRARRLKEKWNLDDDTISYIFEGKKLEKPRSEEGESLDEP